MTPVSRFFDAVKGSMPCNLHVTVNKKMIAGRTICTPFNLLEAGEIHFQLLKRLGQGDNLLGNQLVNFTITETRSQQHFPAILSRDT